MNADDMKKSEAEEIDSESGETLTGRMRNNPWIFSTLVLGFILIVLIFYNGVGRLTGNVISSDVAGERLLDFYTASGAEGLKLNSVDEESGLYKINFDYQGAVIPIYMTKDGKLAGNLNPLKTDTNANTNTNTQEIPKSDKPVVELYVFTYCPYGLQMEKAFIPVVKLLENKIDFKIRQIGAMHGEFEKIEAERQLCIEKEYPTKFYDYLTAFAEDTKIGDCNGDATCLTPKLNALYTKFGIDSKKIDACMSSQGISLYSAEESNAKAKDVSGSPTVIINGVNAQLNRSPEAVKKTICDAFNNAPAECSQILSTLSTSPGFGAGTTSASSTGAQC